MPFMKDQLARATGGRPATARRCSKKAFQSAQAALFVVLFGALPVFAQSGASQSRHARMEDAAREMKTDPRLQKLTQKEQMDLVEFVTGNMLFVAFHESGHALINEMGLPVLGREEDAADSFATLAMLKIKSDVSFRVLFQAARGWFLMDRRDRKQGTMLAFYDEHGLDKQRAFEIICLMVGADDEKFTDLADWAGMPKTRQENCVGDYSNASYSWDLVLKPHLRAADQPKTNIDVTYEEGKGNLDVYARSFRNVRFLETVAEHLEEQYTWRKPIHMKIQSCGQSDARWNIPDKTVYLCYEMAEEFVQLYRGYTEARKPTSQMSSHDLVARNIRKLRALHGMSMRALATDAKLDQGWVSRVERGMEDPSVRELEQLAHALSVQPADFFAMPADGTRVAAKASRYSKRARK
jgi:hypothetical protein